MLHESDLKTYLELVEPATSTEQGEQVELPDMVLRTEQTTERRLFASELKRLAQACRISNVLDDASDSAIDALETIVSGLSDDNAYYAAPTNKTPWMRAIAWAQAEEAEQPGIDIPDLIHTHALHGLAWLAGGYENAAFTLRSTPSAQ